MKRTLLSLIVAGLFTSLAGLAAAQNVTADDKPSKSPPATGTATDAQSRPPTTARQPGVKGPERAVKSEGKADYTAANARAKAAFNDAKVKCDALEGDAMCTCITDANAARTQALAGAKTQSQGRKGGDDAAGGGGKMPTDDTKPGMRSGMDPAPDASNPDAMRDPLGGRFEKCRDDSIVPEAEKFQNVSTAHKAPEGAGAGKAKSN